MTTDVNAAFAAERARDISGAYAARDAAVSFNASREDQLAAATRAFENRISSGKLRDLGNGRFQVNDPGSWDNGEVWTMQAPRLAGEQSVELILPEHGLTTSAKGVVSLYLDAPAWHDVGQVRLGGISDVSKVLELSGLDWEADTRQVRYFDHEGNLREAPGSFVVEKKETGDYLGTVGKIWTPVQNREGFQFLQELVSDGKVRFASAGELYDGKRVFISIRLPEDIVIDAEGVADHVQMHVAVLNSFDGETPFVAVCTPWLPVCGNTERFALRDAVTRWTVRHTKTAMDRIREARRALKLSTAYAEQFTVEENQLARAEFELAEFEKLAATLWKPAEDPTKRQATIEARRNETLREGWAKDTARLGKTAYAAERVITDYLDHAAPRRVVGDKMAAARATAALTGSDDDVKRKAHKQLLELVNH